MGKKDKDLIKPAESHLGNAKTCMPQNQSGITEHNIAEEALKTEKANLDAIFESSPIPMLILDETTNVLAANKAAIDLCGCDKSLVIHHRPGVALHCAHSDAAGCGYGPDCPICPFRRAIEGLIAGSSGPIKNAEVQMSIKRLDKEQNVWLAVSTARLLLNAKQAVCVSLVDITERKKASEEAVSLKESLDSVAGFVFAKDIDLKYVSANRTFCDLLKIPYNKIQGMTDYDIFPPDLAAKYIADDKRVIKTAESITVEEETINSNTNKRFIVQTIKFPRFNKNGRVTGIYGVGYDVTKLKQAEYALKEREYFLNESQKAANIGSYKLDFATNQWQSSEVLDLLFGISRDHPKSLEAWLELVYPDDRQTIDQYMKEEVIAKRKPFDREYRITRRFDETIRWVHGLGRLSLDKDNNLICMTGTIQDITSRKLAENAMRESEAVKNKLISNIGDVIVIIDQNGINKYKSPNVTKLFGWKPEELVGENTWKNVHPDDLEAGQQFVANLLAKPNATGTTEIRYKRKDGNYVWIEISITNLLQDKDVQGLLGNYHEITDRKLIETYGSIGIEILQILTESFDVQEAIKRVLAVLKTQTGADAVGLRLQEGDDFPYIAQDGFSQDFLLTENTLVERGRDGGVCRDKDGNVKLECTCGLVISGKTDPANALFTRGGSCWTNDSFPLLDLPANQDPRLHPRNNCIHQGYASVALIPIRNKALIIGILQLNFKRKGRFTLEAVEILEGIAGHIGSALLRKKMETAILQNDEMLRTRNKELERFNRASVGREVRMIELKNEINELCRKAGLPPRYTAAPPADGVPDAGLTPAEPDRGGD